MTIEPRIADTATPRMFGRHEYVLPDMPICNVPPHKLDDEPHRWTYVRALLLEICDVLPCTPLVLLDRLCTDTTAPPTATVITVIVQDTDDHDHTIVVRRHHGGRNGDGWQLTVNGAIPDGGTGRVRPSPPMLARLIRDAITAQQPTDVGSATD